MMNPRREPDNGPGAIPPPAFVGRGWCGLEALEGRALLSADVSAMDAPPAVDLAVTHVTTTLKNVLIPGDRGKVRAVVSHAGLNTFDATLPLIVEWVGEDDSRTTLATFYAGLSLRAGRSTTVSVPVTVDLDWPTGEGVIAVRFDGSLIGDGNNTNDAGADERGYDLRHQFGKVAGRTGLTKLLFTQGADTVTLSLSGGDGFGEVVFDVNARPSIHLKETTQRSSVKVAVKGGDDIAELARVTIDGNLRSFEGKAADLRGDFLADGLVRKLTLRNVTDGRIAAAGVDFPKQKMTVTLGEVEDVMLETNAAIGTLKVTRWLITDDDDDDDDDDSVIRAPSIATLQATGDFQADVRLTDTINRPALGTATIGGTLRDATWRIAGHVGTFRAGAVAGFALLVGVRSSADPDDIDADDFTRDSEVRSFTVSGLRGAPGDAAVVDLLVAAGRLGTVRLTRIDTSLTTSPHGLTTGFLQRLELSIAAGGATFRAADIDDQGTFNNALQASGIDIGGFAVKLPDLPQFAPPVFFDVVPAAQTPPVPSSGDAADDIAVWVDPLDPSRSLILATNKAGGRNGGIYLYDLQGSEIGSVSLGQGMNNIDLRYGFTHAGTIVDVAAASNRSAHAVDLFIIDPVGRSLVAAGSIPLDEPTLEGFGKAYGLTMHHDRDADRHFVFVSDDSGHIAQFELASVGGQITGQLVRHWKEQSVVEGMVVDDETGTLYVGEEKRGIYACDAAPDAMTATTAAGPPPADRQLVDDMSGPLDADVEGLAIYRTSTGRAYLIASSQGSNQYVIYDAVAFRRLAVLRVVPTPDDTIGGTSDTDGIEAIAGNLGPRFPLGLLIVQDGSNPGGQNFKLVSWADLIDAGQLAGVILEGEALFNPRLND